MAGSHRVRGGLFLSMGYGQGMAGLRLTGEVYDAEWANIGFELRYGPGILNAREAFCMVRFSRNTVRDP